MNPRVNRAFNKQSSRAAAETPVAAGHLPLLIPTAQVVAGWLLSRTAGLQRARLSTTTGLQKVELLAQARCLGNVALEPRPYQLVPLLMALK